MSDGCCLHGIRMSLQPTPSIHPSNHHTAASLKLTQANSHIKHIKVLTHIVICVQEAALSSSQQAVQPSVPNPVISHYPVLISPSELSLITLHMEYTHWSTSPNITSVCGLAQAHNLHQTRETISSKTWTFSSLPCVTTTQNILHLLTSEAQESQPRCHLTHLRRATDSQPANRTRRTRADLNVQQHTHTHTRTHTHTCLRWSAATLH